MVCPTPRENWVIAFLTRGPARSKQNVVDPLCHAGPFFKSKQAGLAWIGRHPGTFLPTVDQAHSLARKNNTLQFPDSSGNIKDLSIITRNDTITDQWD